MYIFQPDRFLLKKQVIEASHYIRGDVLDVGAGGNDRYSNHFKCSNYTKMDVAEGPNVDVVGSAENIPFSDNNFDSVVCTQVFEHLARPHLCAKEIYRVLRAGGHDLVTVPQMNELHEEPYDFYRYTKFGLNQLFSDAGFTVVECKQRGGFFSTISQMVIRYFIDLLHLYKKPMLGRIFNQFAKVIGIGSIWLDSFDKSIANHKHAIGWCVVLKK
ncbi:MAG: class I SAM-dependent methyltransferase [Patescibacteria group bacterium]